MRKNGRVKVITKTKENNTLNKSTTKGKKCLLPTPKLISISELCRYSSNYNNTNIKLAKNVENNTSFEFIGENFSDLSKSLSPQTVQKSVRFAKLSLSESIHSLNSLEKSNLMLQRKSGARVHSILKRTSKTKSKGKKAEDVTTTVSSLKNISQGILI